MYTSMLMRRAPETVFRVKFLVVQEDEEGGHTRKMRPKRPKDITWWVVKVRIFLPMFPISLWLISNHHLYFSILETYVALPPDEQRYTIRRWAGTYNELLYLSSTKPEFRYSRVLVERPVNILGTWIEDCLLCAAMLTKGGALHSYRLATRIATRLLKT